MAKKKKPGDGVAETASRNSAAPASLSAHLQPFPDPKISANVPFLVPPALIFLGEKNPKSSIWAPLRVSRLPARGATLRGAGGWDGASLCCRLPFSQL